MVEIRYAVEFNKEYLKLKEKANKGNTEANYLLELIQKSILKLSENRETGTKIPKRLWPKEYIQKFDIHNLWKYNLDKSWRLMYAIEGTEINLFLIYLEFLDHKHYDRKFGYKTS